MTAGSSIEAATPARSASRVRVRYAETDQMGVVYYANYFVWFEVGRTDLLRTLGGTYRELEAEGIFLPVIEAACEYVQPSRYDDELEIRTEGRVLSPIRVEFRYEVVRLGDGAVVATGRTSHAAINRGGRPCRLPARVREALSGGVVTARGRGASVDSEIS
jgi:acyl-CoA thioester hydrolase